MLKQLAGIILLLGSLTANATTSYNGVEIKELYKSMRFSDKAKLTGDYENDKPIFKVTWPRYLSNQHNAKLENSSIAEINIDNYREWTKLALRDYIARPHLFDEIYYTNSILGRTGETRRNLYTFYCHDKRPYGKIKIYFYCFSYKNRIYKIDESIDYYDKKVNEIRPVWRYQYYDIGNYPEFHSSGPYGVLPKSVLSGRDGQPEIFIN